MDKVLSVIRFFSVHHIDLFFLQFTYRSLENINSISQMQSLVSLCCLSVNFCDSILACDLKPLYLSSHDQVDLFQAEYKLFIFLEQNILSFRSY